MCIRDRDFTFQRNKSRAILAKLEGSMSGTAVDQCEGRRAAHAQGAISALLRRREISLRAVISRAARAMPNVARRMGSRVLRGLSILAALVILIPAVTAPTAARAQAQAPYNGWCTVIAAGELQCFGEPLQACQLQWEIYSGGSPFEGFSNVYNSSGALDQIAKQCLWTCLLYTSDAADDLLCVDLGG